jgi:hypothetical protein
MFVGGVTPGLLITDEAAAPVRGTTDIDVIAEIVPYADYIAFSERLREARFTEDTGLTSRWHNCALTLYVLANSEANVPAGLDVHVIQDSYGTHTMQL